MSSELNITQDPTGFSKSFTTKFPNDPNTEFFFHKIELADKQIISIHTNGIIDTTFEIPMSTKATINYASSMELDGETVGTPEPVLLVGDHANMKIQVVASQIAKLIALQHPKSTVLSIGSKWFGRGDEVEENDFEKCLFVIENVKKLFQI